MTVGFKYYNGGAEGKALVCLPLNIIYLNLMSSYEEFLHKLNLIPPQADKILRQIRQLDQQVEQTRLAMEPLRQTFLDKLQTQTGHKTAKARHELEQDYRVIARLENDIEAKSKEKIMIAERLYTLIHEPTEKLERELQQRGVEKGEEDLRRKRGKKVLRKLLKRGEWEYDPNEPKYCYCSRPSFGEMVMCDNTFCEREWFHLECIEEKKLPQKWFCKACRNESTLNPPKKPRSK